MPTKFRTKDPIRNLFIITNNMSRVGDRILKKFDLTVEQYRVMKCIYDEDGATQREVCEIMYKTPANLTRITDRLESKNLVKRKQSKQDRRSTILTITSKGVETIGTIEDIIISYNDDLLKGISDEEIENLNRMIFTIDENLCRLEPGIE